LFSQGEETHTKRVPRVGEPHIFIAKFSPSYFQKEAKQERQRQKVLPFNNPIYGLHIKSSMR
jgi:hypothetical protein